MTASIVLDSVTKRYGSSVIIRNISFEVHPGEIVGFLGPNGAGKTTTLRMIAGYTAASQGTVSVCGQDMARQHVRAAPLVGYLPERPPLYDTLTVQAYLRFVAKAKRCKSDSLKQEIRTVATACHIEHVLDLEVYKLSKGYRQRVGLAQALLGQPRVLLLDEPTAGLDPEQLHEIREVISNFGREHAVLISTHLLPEATRICDRVAIINNGELLAIDSPAELSRRAQRSNLVALQIRSSQVDKVTTLLSSLHGVNSVDVEAVEDNLVSCVCHVDDTPDIEARVAKAVSADHFDLLYLERQQPSLENVFLSYVSTQSNNSTAVQNHSPAADSGGIAGTVA